MFDVRCSQIFRPPQPSEASQLPVSVQAADREFLGCARGSRENQRVGVKWVTGLGKASGAAPEPLRLSTSVIGVTSYGRGAVPLQSPFARRRAAYPPSPTEPAAPFVGPGAAAVMFNCFGMAYASCKVEIIGADEKPTDFLGSPDLYLNSSAGDEEPIDES